MKTFFILSLLVLSQAVSVYSQSREDREEARFTAYVVAGANFSQIDGDAAWGYTKVGFNGGARGGINFGEKMELCTEILFSQKGAANLPRNSQNFSSYTIHLDYVEVPLLFYYKDWDAFTKDNEMYKRLMLGGGLSYSRLLNTNLTGTLSHPMGIEEAYTKNDLMFIIDANVFFLKNWGLNIRWSRSLTTIYNDEQPGDRPDYAINRSIICRLVYKF